MTKALSSNINSTLSKSGTEIESEGGKEDMQKLGMQKAEQAKAIENELAGKLSSKTGKGQAAAPSAAPPSIAPSSRTGEDEHTAPGRPYASRLAAALANSVLLNATQQKQATRAPNTPVKGRKSTKKSTITAPSTPSPRPPGIKKGGTKGETLLTPGSVVEDVEDATTHRKKRRESLQTRHTRYGMPDDEEGSGVPWAAYTVPVSASTKTKKMKGRNSVVEEEEESPSATKKWGRNEGENLPLFAGNSVLVVANLDPDLAPESVLLPRSAAVLAPESVFISATADFVPESVLVPDEGHNKLQDGVLARKERVFVPVPDGAVLNGKLAVLAPETVLGPDTESGIFPKLSVQDTKSNQSSPAEVQMVSQTSVQQCMTPFGKSNQMLSQTSVRHCMPPFGRSNKMFLLCLLKVALASGGVVRVVCVSTV